MVRRGLRLGMVGAAVWLGTSVAWADDEEALARELVGKWVEARQLRSSEEQEWRLGRDLLAERIELAKRENQTLAERTARVREDLAQTDVARTETAEKLAALDKATEGLGAGLGALEARVLKLIAQVPPYLSEKVKPLSQRIPVDPSKTTLSIGERFQNVVGVLNELNKASREVYVGSAVHDLENGQKAEVTLVHIGLSQAYYFNENSGLAGWGVPNKDHWEWVATNAIVQAVADIVAIQRNEKPAAHVRLPFEVR